MVQLPNVSPIVPRHSGAKLIGNIRHQISNVAAKIGNCRSCFGLSFDRAINPSSKRFHDPVFRVMESAFRVVCPLYWPSQLAQLFPLFAAALFVGGVICLASSEATLLIFFIPLLSVHFFLFWVVSCFDTSQAANHANTITDIAFADVAIDTRFAGEISRRSGKLTLFPGDYFHGTDYIVLSVM